MPQGFSTTYVRLFPKRYPENALENCQRYSVEPRPATDGLLAFVRLLSRLSPQPEDGGAIKRKVLDQLVSQIPTMQAADIGTMRNLDLSAFVDGQVIWDAVATWMER